MQFCIYEQKNQTFLMSLIVNMIRSLRYMPKFMRRSQLKYLSNLGSMGYNLILWMHMCSVMVHLAALLQATEETETYGSEFVAAWICIEQIIYLHDYSKIFGCSIP